MGAAGDFVKEHAGRIAVGIATGGASEGFGIRTAMQAKNGYDPLDPGSIDPLVQPPAPPPPPDLADELAKRADLAKQQRLFSSGGNGTFLSGPLGDTSGTISAPGGK